MKIALDETAGHGELNTGNLLPEDNINRGFLRAVVAKQSESDTICKLIFHYLCVKQSANV